MSHKDAALLDARLRELFPDRHWQLTEPWEQSTWSKSYRVEFTDQEIMYIKGTPRVRTEAAVTALLHRLCPDAIPKVLIEDLVPEQEWRWFLLEEAGTCDHEGITPGDAILAADQLGRLQRRVCHTKELASSLLHCRAQQVQEALLHVCIWALDTASAEQHDELHPFREQVARSTAFFTAVGQELSHLPPTVIHGDFWSGNIAFRGSSVRFIDWGDALWGVGSVSIVNLLSSESETVSGHEASIWGAYGRAWEAEMPQAFIDASRVAWMITLLIVDVEIAKCRNQGADTLRGLLPGIRALTPHLST